MVKQHMPVAHRNHVFVEDAAVDGNLVLLGEQRELRVELMQPRHCFARFARLACRIALRRNTTAERAATVDKQLNTLAVIVSAKTVMVSRALITKVALLWQRIVVAKVRVIVKGGAQDRRSHWRFKGAVQLIVEVRHGKMHPTICAVCRGRHRRRICRPH